MQFDRLLRTIITLLFLVPTFAAAQSPRKILVEEFTNAWGGDAVKQDSVFQLHYINEPRHFNRIIPIVYHTSFPGYDTLNRLHPDVHNSRVSYYGITRVPEIRIDGRVPAQGNPFPGAPADTAVIDAAAAAAGTSPVTITIDANQLGTPINGKVRVSSSAPLNGARLYIMAMQLFGSSMMSGVNTLQYYYHYPEAMIPNAGGTALTLAAGETKEVTFAYPADPYYASSMYFVAFVQDTTTKEVLQAESSIIMPSFALDRDNPVVQQENTPIVWNAEVRSSRSARFGTFLLSGIPQGWSYNITMNGRKLSDGDSVDLGPDTAAAMHVEITPGATSADRRAVLVIAFIGTLGYSNSINLALYSGPIATLGLYRDRNYVAVQTAFEEALDRRGESYASLRDGDERYFDLSKHVVIYATGKQGVPLHDLALLRSTLDNGGRMLLTGAELGYSLGDPGNSSEIQPTDPALLHDYLHADYVVDKSSSFVVNGASGDPVGNGFSFRIDDGIQTQDAPDVIAPRDGAAPVYYYGTGTSEVAGIRYADARYRLVYLGFGLEGIDDQAVRADALDRIIAWLRASSGVQTPSFMAETLGDPRPNPTSGIVAIPVAMDHGAEARVEIYDVRGARVARSTLAITAGVLRVDCGELPAGTYNVVVRSGASVGRTMLNVVR